MIMDKGNRNKMWQNKFLFCFEKKPWSTKSVSFRCPALERDFQKEQMKKMLLLLLAKFVDNEE